MSETDLQPDVYRKALVVRHGLVQGPLGLMLLHQQSPEVIALNPPAPKDVRERRQPEIHCFTCCESDRTSERFAKMHRFLWRILHTRSRLGSIATDGDHLYTSFIASSSECGNSNTIVTSSHEEPPLSLSWCSLATAAHAANLLILRPAASRASASEAWRHQRCRPLLHVSGVSTAATASPSVAAAGARMDGGSSSSI